MKVLKWVPVAEITNHVGSDKFKNGTDSAEESLDAFDVRDHCSYQSYRPRAQKNGTEQSLRSSGAFTTRMVRPPTDFSALTVDEKGML